MRKKEAKLHPRRTALLMLVYSLLLAIGAALPLAASYSDGERESAPRVERVDAPSAVRGS